MIKPKIVKFRVVKQLLSTFHIEIESGKRHLRLRGPRGGTYPIPRFKDNDDVERCYIDGIRRAFRLTIEDGVSDEDFYQKK